MATGGPGGFKRWTPTPPERGSFPLDHDGECRDQMLKYLQCMKYTGNMNAPNCRILSKQYLKCRMEHDLMENSDWDSLGLVNLPGDQKQKEPKKENQTKKESGPNKEREPED